MTDTLSPEEKETFKRATARRKENGVRLKRIFLWAEASQVEAFYELWNSYVLRWGKESAMDHLIRLMSRLEAHMTDIENAPDRKRS